MMSATEQTRLSHTAANLVEIVRDRPGIHFRGLARAASISSMGQLRHHVDRLMRSGVIVEVEDGRYKRFFLAGNHPPNLRRTLARFSRPVPRRIGRLLLWRPMTRGELRRTLGCADSTLGYHLARMSLHGDVVKTGASNRCRYTLADPETVRLALVLQNMDAPPSEVEAVETLPSIESYGGPVVPEAPEPVAAGHVIRRLYVPSDAEAKERALVHSE